MRNTLQKIQPLFYHIPLLVISIMVFNLCTREKDLTGTANQTNYEISDTTSFSDQQNEESIQESIFGNGTSDEISSLQVMAK